VTLTEGSRRPLTGDVHDVEGADAAARETGTAPTSVQYGLTRRPTRPDTITRRFTEADYLHGMQRLVDTVQELSMARTVSEIQRIVGVTARRITGCDGATFVLRDEDHCFYAEEDAIAPLWKGKRFPMQDCISGWVMQTRQSATVPDIYDDPRIPQDAYRPTFVKSLVMVPIRQRNPIGAIGNYWARRREPTHLEVELLQALADVTSVAMDNALVHAALERHVGDRPATFGTPIVAEHGADPTYEAAFTNAPIGMAVVGLDGSFRRVNRELCRITGYDERELTTLTFQDITHPDDLHTDVGEASRLLAGEIASYQLDKRYYSKDGHVIWVRLSAFLIDDFAGQPVSFIAHVEDISARRRDEELLRRRATRDALTGVYNRSHFDDELARYQMLATRHGDTDEAAVFMIDLDELKQVNDRHGHTAGDVYLKTVADILSRGLRLSDVIARVGGDEFAVLLPHTSAPQARHLAQTLVEQAKTNSPGSISIGIATMSPGTLDGALDRADQAMYKAKRNGGSHWYGPE